MGGKGDGRVGEGGGGGGGGVSGGREEGVGGDLMDSDVHD